MEVSYHVVDELPTVYNYTLAGRLSDSQAAVKGDGLVVCLCSVCVCVTCSLKYLVIFLWEVSITESLTAKGR